VLSPLQPSMDWGFLRQEGLNGIQQMNEESLQWTDYNISDPGITILESLCYVITDLGYRLNFPIEDLLASDQPMTQYLLPKQALPSIPVTLNDYRQLLLGINGVGNVWIVLSDAKTQTYDTYISITDFTNQASILEQCDTLLQQNRLEGITFAASKGLTPSEIGVQIDLELLPSADPTYVKQEASRALWKILTQPLTHYSFEAIREMGESVEQVLEGPLNENGFIRSLDLNTTASTATPSFDIYRSHIIQTMSALDGVMDVKSVQLFTTAGAETWIVVVKDGKIPTLNPENSTLTMIQNGISSKAEPFLSFSMSPVKSFTVTDLIPPKGKNRNLSTYSSLQNELPSNYEVGSYGKGQTNQQLRAYLLLFDQVLADNFEQLSKVPEMLAMAQNSIGNNTCFAQQLPSNAWQEAFPELYESFQSQSCCFEQRSGILDVLLALYGESFIPLNVYEAIQSIFANPCSQESYLDAKSGYLAQLGELQVLKGSAQGMQKSINLSLGMAPDTITLLSTSPFEMTVSMKLESQAISAELRAIIITTVQSMVPAHYCLTYKEALDGSSN